MMSSTDEQPEVTIGLDDAVAALDELPGKPIDEQLAVLEQIHSQLKESLDTATQT